MEGFDPQFAINMPTAQPQQGFWDKAFDALQGVGESIEENPEKFGIVLDALGRGFDPNNPFAGIGTSLAKSSLVEKEEAAGEKETTDMLQQMTGIIQSLTAGDKEGPSTVTTSMNADGKHLDYTIKGLGSLSGSGGVETEAGPRILTDEDFALKFGESGGL